MTSQANFGFNGEAIKRAEMIDFSESKNETVIEYPGIVQSLLDLWILSNGFSQVNGKSTVGGMIHVFPRC